MDDSGSVVGELDGLFVGNGLQFHGLRIELRVGIQQSGYILPDGNALGIKQVGDDGSGVVRPLSPKSGGGAVGGSRDEALRDAQLRGVPAGGERLLQQLLRIFPLDAGLRVGAVP